MNGFFSNNNYYIGYRYKPKGRGKQERCGVCCCSGCKLMKIIKGSFSITDVSNVYDRCVRMGLGCDDF